MLILWHFKTLMTIEDPVDYTRPPRLYKNRTTIQERDYYTRIEFLYNNVIIEEYNYY